MPCRIAGRRRQFRDLSTPQFDSQSQSNYYAQDDNPAKCGRLIAVFLPIHLHRELKLPGIVRRCRLPRVGIELVDCRDVVFVRDIEHIHDQVQVHTFAKINPPRNPQIVEHSPGLESGIPPQVAIQQKQRARRSQLRRREVSKTYFLEKTTRRIFGRNRGIAASVRRSSRGNHIRTASTWVELKIVAGSRQDVKGRPEPTSRMGATVQLLKNLSAKLSPPSLPL